MPGTPNGISQNYDWPNPRGPRRTPPDFQGSYNLNLPVAATIPPVLRAEQTTMAQGRRVDG